MTTNTTTYRIVSPQETQGRTNVGTYAEQYGWRVVSADGYTAYSGNKRGALKYQRFLNSQS